MRPALLSLALAALTVWGQDEPAPPTKIIVVVVVQDGKVAVATDPRPDGVPSGQGPTPDAGAAARPMVVAGRQYTRGTRDALLGGAAWVRQNPGGSKAALMERLKVARAPVVLAFETALDKAIDPHVARDEVGTFQDAAAVARALDEAGRGVGSP